MDDANTSHGFGRNYVPVILREWETLVVVHEPWEVMPRDDRFGELGAVTAVVLHVVLRNPPKRGVPSDVVRTAVRHGRFRRQQGCPEEVLPYELGVLRQAVRIGLRKSGLSPDMVSVALDRAEDLWPITKRASVLGFREPEPDGLTSGADQAPPPEAEP